MREYRDRQRGLDHLLLHLTTWADELTEWELRWRKPLTGWTVAGPGAAPRPIEIGGAWDDRHGIHIFRHDAPVSVTDPHAEIRLDFGGEALVQLLDAQGAQIAAFGANPRHPRFAPLPAQPFTIQAQVAARSLFGIPNREPRLTRAEITSHYPEIRALRRRIEIARDTAKTVTQPELARALCEAAIHALSLLRLPTATQEVGPRVADRQWARDIWERSFEPTDTPPALSGETLASVAAATARLDADLADLRAAYPKQGKVLATGHAHIDYAWLWPQPETVRKIHRTFSNVEALMGAHEDFTFLQSSSLLYRHIEEDDPALLARIQERVKEGKWEPIGGMFIECDTNMPSAEAFLRQFLIGQQDFIRYFGQISRTAWLPDTFGFTGAMPQIMRHAGIDALVTIKVTWSETNKMPDNVFLWQGNDGTEVLTHTYDAYRSDGYNMWMTAGALAEVWGNHLGKDLTDTVIASYGWGDGGGGPDPDQIEAMPILNLMPAIPQVSHGNIQSHLDRIRADLTDAPAMPRWSGEMYLEYHRATLTTQGRTKQLNRRAEHGLVAAEALGGLAELSGIAITPANLSDDWALTLRNQFHDILPGSSIREVYVQSEAEMEGVVSHAERVAQDRLTAIAAAQAGPGVAGIAVANLSGSAKPHWQVTSDAPLPAALSPQQVGDQWVASSDQPLAPLSISHAATPSAARAMAAGQVLENDLVRVTLDAQGRIASYLDKRAGRDLIQPGGAGNRLMLYRNDLPRQYDAWDIEPGFDLGGEEITALDVLRVTASGPHLAEITVTRSLGASRISQRLRLWANSPRLDIVTDLDWHDRRSYLRAEFDLNVLAETADFDQAIGITRRATHDNTSWQKAQFEACGHRFVSLSETDWGGAILSADKYGFSAKGQRLTISLVRGPMYPDMLADEGRHAFAYALLPHDGRWQSAEVQAEADLVADPLRFVAATGPDWRVQPVAWSGHDLRVHALKPAEDGRGHILRLSEAAGRRGPLTLNAGEISAVDALERPVDTATGNLRPFQLLSLRLGG